MAKRTRGSGRPGQRRPLQRPAARPSPETGRTGGTVRETLDRAPSPRPSTSLTAEEEARAAEIEERLREEERAAEESQRRTRERARTAELAGARAREAAPLAVRAAAEYAYVRRDIGRIARITTVLLAILAVLHVLINVTGTIRI